MRTYFFNKKIQKWFSFNALLDPKKYAIYDKSYKKFNTRYKKNFLKKIKLIEKYKISSSKIWFDLALALVNFSTKFINSKNIDKFKIKNYGLLIGSSRKLDKQN